jgi:hypothetical protein
MEKYTVIRTDNLSGTDQRADLLSVRVYDESGKPIAVENGTIVKVGDLEDGEREIYKATVAAAGDNLDECAILAGVEVEYDETKRNLDQYINKPGKPIRAYIPRNRNFFSVTAEGFVGGTAPAKDAEVGIGANGKLDASATGFGVCRAIEIAGRYTYYVIQIKKA